MQPVNSGPGGSQQQNQIKVRLATPRRIGSYFSQCCGSGMFIPDPGSEFFHPGSRVKNIRIRIRIKDFYVFLTQKMFLNSWKNDLGCLSRVRIPDPDPWVKK
jgi:hypothetical protein